MTGVEELALRVLADLAGAGRRGAVVGGLAVSVQALPRTTRDVDFAVDIRSDDEAEDLVFLFREKGYSLYDVLEQVTVGRLATARFRVSMGKNREGAVDLLFASSGIEPEIVAAATRIEFLPGAWLPVARRGHLIALKVLSYEEVRRAQDRLDIMALLERAGPEDLQLAREALALITARDFHRNKDLAAELGRLLELERGSQ